MEELETSLEAGRGDAPHDLTSDLPEYAGTLSTSSQDATEVAESSSFGNNNETATRIHASDGVQLEGSYG